MQVTYQYSGREFQEIRSLTPWWRLWRAVLLRVFVAVLPATALLVVLHNYLAFAIAGLLLTVFFLYLHWPSRRDENRDAIASTAITVSVLTDTLQLSSEGAVMRLHGSIISDVRRQGSFLIISVGEDPSIMIPQRAFADPAEASAYENAVRLTRDRGRSHMPDPEDFSHWEPQRPFSTRASGMSVEYTNRLWHFRKANRIAFYPADDSGRSKGDQNWPTYLIVTGTAITAAVMGNNTAFAVMAFLMLLIWPMLRIRRRFDARWFEARCRRWRTVISPPGVRNTSSGDDVSFRWSELRDVRISKKLILFVMADGGLIPIPTDAFHSPDEAMEFFDAARGFFQRATRSTDSEPTGFPPAEETGNPYQSPSP